MSAIISLQEAYKKLEEPNIVFIDTQFIFGKSPEGRSYYEEKHIPGAVYFHLDEDMSGPILEHGGRHPIPDEPVFIEKLRSAGINNDSDVIVYDNTGGATAARMWWLLKYFGHKKCYVLEQPIQKWLEAGFPVSTVVPQTRDGHFIAHIQQSLAVSMENVLEHLGDPNRVLIDARVEEVYSGERKTKYKKIGHIPTASNLFWERLLDGNLRLIKKDPIRKILHKTNKDKEIVVYCGAGVTACADVLALTEDGFSDVKLYVGSWGDWSSYDHTPAQLSFEK